MSDDEITPDAGKRLSLETAHYIAELTAEMSFLAQRADLDRIAQLLDLVRLEAEQLLQKNSFKPD